PSVIGNITPNYNDLEVTVDYKHATNDSRSQLPGAAVPPEDRTSVEEPVAAAFRQGWHTLREAYHENPLPNFLKVVILIALSFSALRTIQVWFPIVTTCLITYFVYRVVWTVIVKPAAPRQAKYHRGPTYPPAASRAEPQSS